MEQVDADALERALQTREGSWLPWGRQRYFDRRAFDADLKRIEAFYRDRGFPDAHVTSFDVALNDAQDAVSITVHISEGEPIRVAAIELAGFEVLPEDDRERLREAMQLSVDRPLDRQLVLAARERAANELRDSGYPYAVVRATEHDAGPDRRRVVFEASPGTLARIGEIEVEGEESVGEAVIRRQLTFAPGDRYSRRELRESQRRLYGLELFEFVNIESLEDRTPQAPEVPVRVTVAEGDHQRVTFGAGYGTEEQARARIRWDHVNFLGGARHAGLEGKWSSLDRGLRAEYRQPAFWHPHFTLNFDGQAWQAAEPVYSLNSLGGRMTLRHQANVRMPELTFSSRPPLDQADILSLIVFNVPTSQLGEGQQVSLTEYAGALAGGYFVSGLTRSIADALDLDEFEIQTQGEAGVGPSLSIGEQVGERLFVRIRQGFGAEEATEFILEYQIADFLRLQGAVAETTGGTQRVTFRRIERGGLDLIFFFSY